MRASEGKQTTHWIGPHVLVHRRTRLTFRAGPTAGEARPHGVDSNDGGGAEGRGAARKVGGGAGLARGAGRGDSTNLSLAKACGGLAPSLCELHRTASELLAGSRFLRNLQPSGIYAKDTTRPGPRQRLSMEGVGEMWGAVSGHSERRPGRGCGLWVCVRTHMRVCRPLGA